MQYESPAYEYIPGTCNIGRQEIARRYRTAYAGMILSVLLVILLELLDMNTFWRLMIFFPALLISSGFIQARRRFCLAYGWRGVFSVHGYRKTTRVMEPEFLRADRRTALRLTLSAAGGAAFIAACYYFVGRFWIDLLMV